jgi:hypothetical protein
VTAQIFLAKTQLGWREDLPVAPSVSPPSFVVVVDSKPGGVKPSG